MKIHKLLLSASLLLLLYFLPAVCSAAPSSVQATEEEIRSLLSNRSRSLQINEILQLSSTDSQKRLLKVTADLNLSQEKLLKSELALEELQTRYNKLQKDLEAMTLSSKSQEDLIARTNVLFEQYSKETKAQIKRLKVEKGVWQAITVVAVGVLINQAMHPK